MKYLRINLTDDVKHLRPEIVNKGDDEGLTSEEVGACRKVPVFQTLLQGYQCYSVIRISVESVR